MSLCSTSRCPCSDSPFANLSSERPDHPVWVGMQWADQTPFLGSNWTSHNCNASFLSEVSQQDADMKAAAAAQECVPESCLGPCCPCTSEDPNCNPCACEEAGDGCQPLPPFCNTTQNCANDQTHATVAACSVVAQTQADADAIAASICNEIIRTDGIPNPPVSVCPVILGIFPPSPVVASQGETVVLSASVSYSGTGTLSFLWSLDGFPLSITAAPVLVLNNITDSDAGTYQLQVSVSDCPPVLSNQLNLIVCPIWPLIPQSPSGAQAFLIPFDGPTGYPIEIGWESVTLNVSDFSVQGIAFGDAVWATAPWAGQPDHPPGNYVLEYQTGFFYLDAAGSLNFGCGPGQTASFVWIHGQRDTNIPLVFPDPFDNKDVSFDMVNVGTCSIGVAGVQAFWNGFIGARSIPGDLHDNLGGGFFAWDYDNAGTWPFANLINDPAHALQFKVFQISGCIQQVRQMSVSNWATVSAPFPDQIKLSWDGIFDDRSEYLPSRLSVGASTPNLGVVRPEISKLGNTWTFKFYDGLVLQWQGDKIGGSTAQGTYNRTAGALFDPQWNYFVPKLEWSSPAAGSFGGAKVSYIQNHPIATNDCGWILEIYNQDLSVFWRGYKATGSDGSGTYIKSADSPNGYVCSLEVVNL